MMKVEAVVVRDRVETVMEAVEAETGHVGVTVLEAVGHGRERGITHEYRGRVFESRFLPKAHLTFVVRDEIAEQVIAAIADAARTGYVNGDGICWMSPVYAATHNRTGQKLEEVEVTWVNPWFPHEPPPSAQFTEAFAPRLPPGKARLRRQAIAHGSTARRSTTLEVWADEHQGARVRGEHDLGRRRRRSSCCSCRPASPFSRPGLTRMKNVGHIAAKNVLILGVVSIVYYLVGFGIAFGDGGGALVGGSGFAPSVDELLAIGAEPFSWFGSIPGAAGYLFEVAFAAVSLAIVWGAMAERTRLWVYIVFGVVFTLIYSVVSHWVWSPDGWLFSKGMQDFAGSTVVHYQGALAGLAGALLLGPRIGKYVDGKPQPIPGHNMAYTTLGVIILWFGWFGFNPGSTLSVDFGGVGFFAYVALNTNLAASAGVLGAVTASWIVIKKPDLSMMLNGAIAALVAITAACAFVAPWAAIVIGFVAGVIVVLRLAARRARRHRRPDGRARRAWHGRSLGDALARVPRPAGTRREARALGAAASSTEAASTSWASRCSGSSQSARSRSQPRSSSSG